MKLLLPFIGNTQRKWQVSVEHIFFKPRFNNSKSIIHITLLIEGKKRNPRDLPENKLRLYFKRNSMECGFVMQISTILSILWLYNKNELQNKVDSQNECNNLYLLVLENEFEIGINKITNLYVVEKSKEGIGFR